MNSHNADVAVRLRNFFHGVAAAEDEKVCGIWCRSESHSGEAVVVGGMVGACRPERTCAACCRRRSISVLTVYVYGAPKPELKDWVIDWVVTWA